MIDMMKIVIQLVFWSAWIFASTISSAENGSSTVSTSGLEAVCQKISNWKPGESGPSVAEYLGEMNVVDFDFLLAHLNQKNWILLDSRGDKERGQGFFRNALSLRSGLKPEDSDDYQITVVIQKLANFLFQPKLGWNDIKKMNFMIFCNGEKCPKSAKAGCSLRKLGIPANQIHLLPLSYDQLYSSGLSLFFEGSELSQKNVENRASTELHVLRLKPGMDLKKSIFTFQKMKNIQAGSVVSAVGSLTQAKLRFANKSEIANLQGPFEIVSLSGTIGSDGMHLHLGISDAEGKTQGGHLAEGSIVFTTAELTILEAKNLKFERQKDEITTYDELVIKVRN